MRTAAFSIQSLKAQLSLLIVCTVICLLPFAGKAFNMDDPLFIWVAKNIQLNPLDPYGFNVNWYETEMRMSDVNKNPPLASYFLSIVGSVFGWSEAAIHIAFLLPALVVIIGTYLLARHYCANALLASLATLFTPVFLVSATTVMSDVMMLAFWIIAIYSWISGLEKDSNLLLLFSGILVSLSALTKYFGLTLIPLLLLYSILKRRTVGRWIMHLLLPVVILAWYQWATGQLYGRGLLTDATSYAVAFPSEFGRISFPKILVGLSFTGGCFLVVLFFTRLLWSWKGVAVGALLAAGVAVMVASAGALGSFQIPADAGARWIISLEFGFFVYGGISLLFIVFLDLVQRRDAESGLLFLWFMGAFVFATFVNWTTAARSILPLAPVAGILIARRIERQTEVRNNISPRQILTPLIGAAAMALAVTWADYRLANSARAAAAEIHERYIYNRNTSWFTGHWGFQYYMQLFGGRPFDAERSLPAAGDLYVVPANNANLLLPPSELVQLREVLEVPSSSWISTMNLAAGAGFYTDMWGPLPFSLGALPLEHYYIYEMRSF